MKKILIVYATAGIGHKKASMAVKKAFDEMALKDVQVSMMSRSITEALKISAKKSGHAALMRDTRRG